MAHEYDGGLSVNGCDIALVGERPVVIEEHQGDVTVTSSYKDFEMPQPEGWSNTPSYFESAAPEE